MMEPRHRDGLWARTANLLLSGWLMVSGFAWDAGGARTNAAVVGYLVFVFTLLATGWDRARALNTLLGMWLLASAWVIPPARAAMRWNTVLVGLAILVLSLVAKEGDLGPPSVRALAARHESGAHAH